MRRFWGLLGLSLLLACKDDQFITIRVKDVDIRVEVADTPEKKIQGLMFREFLPPDEGMLFVYEKEQKMAFWMKNTGIPLSIAFINKEGVLLEIYDMEPFSTLTIESRRSALYALEVNQGFFEAKGIRVGDRFEIPGE